MKKETKLLNASDIQEIERAEQILTELSWKWEDNGINSRLLERLDTIREKLYELKVL